LIVRQLLLGSARFRDLASGLPGIASNLLTERLRLLEAAGVIQRQSAAMGDTHAYALTDWGRELKVPINGLIRWSTPLMVTGPGSDAFQPDWLAIALPALLQNRLKAATSVTIGVAVGEDTYRLTADAGRIDVKRADGGDLQATIYADGMMILGLASGMLQLDDVRHAVEISGDESAVRAAFAMSTETV
jgi:hypothetical protein